jgi:OOP family OmpA-OmpF porin
MKGMKALLTAASLAGVLAMAGPAAAQLYLGATIGQAEFKEGCLGTGECDEKDTAWRILGGYQFNKFFAAELGYYLRLRQGRRLPGHAQRRRRR